MDVRCSSVFTASFLMGVSMDYESVVSYSILLAQNVYINKTGENSLLTIRDNGAHY